VYATKTNNIDSNVYCSANHMKNAYLNNNQSAEKLINGKISTEAKSLDSKVSLMVNITNKPTLMIKRSTENSAIEVTKSQDIHKSTDINVKKNNLTITTSIQASKKKYLFEEDSSDETSCGNEPKPNSDIKDPSVAKTKGRPTTSSRLKSANEKLPVKRKAIVTKEESERFTAKKRK
jgi:hypothetical protein